MRANDKSLGMHLPITRRDILQGGLALSATSLLPNGALNAQGNGPYPPSLTGMRGTHDGAFEVAHAVARYGQTDFGPVSDAGEYDLVVVGAGISGLSAAYFYRQENPSARILLLDNHDDFGGHARRNEFEVSGKTLIGYGGSQTLEQPELYSSVPVNLLQELGIDVDRFETAYDKGFFRRYGLGAATHFSAKAWGTSALVRYDMTSFGSFIFLDPAAQDSPEDVVAQMPLSDDARAQLLRLLTIDEDQFPDLSYEEKREYLGEISYQEFIEEVAGIDHPEVIRMFKNLATDSGLGIELTSAYEAMSYAGLPPGPAVIGLDRKDFQANYIHHFPDGNASIARLLVSRLIPEVSDGSDMENIVTAEFDYDMLDRPGSQVRLRLSSTAISAVNTDDGGVRVDYVTDGKAQRVRGRHCVLACYNRMIPSLCPEIGEQQEEALSSLVKTPMLYTNVALTNWRAWEKLGIAAMCAPDGYHSRAMLDFPVNLGGYEYAKTPDDPILVHMDKFFIKPNEGLSSVEQWKAGREELFRTPFGVIEREIREQLGDALSGGDFDPARDIAAITVNRWSHGYAYSYPWDSEDWYDDMDDPRFPHVRGRQPIGNISIANTDAAGTAYVNTAIEQAYRAVGELLG